MLNLVFTQYLNGYHLSVTKLNGLLPNYLFKYHQHKPFFNHQIKLFITKLNQFSPNELILLSPNILTSHQKELYKAKPVLSKKYLFFMTILYLKQRICFKFHLFTYYNR